MTRRSVIESSESASSTTEALSRRTFLAASAAAGALWMSGGPGLTFGMSAAVATMVLILLLLWPMSEALASHPQRGQAGSG